MMPICYCLKLGESAVRKNTETTDRPGDKARNLLPEMWQEVCERAGSLSFRVVSGSMEPLVGVGDKVNVARAEPSRLHIGDIVAFRDGQNVLVHRVIGRSRSDGQFTFRHRGDAGTVSGIFTANNLIGKVCAIEKDKREINLEAPRYTISNKILGWRLRLKDSLGRSRYTSISNGIRIILRPMWRLCRSLLLPHSPRESQ